MSVSIDEWKSKGELVLEPEAIKALKNLNNSLVIAGPGAGKTELLAQKASFLLETNNCKYPQKILAISFKKDAAKNLKERINERISKKDENRFISQTFDSFAKNLLDRFLNSLPREYRPNKNYKICLHDNNLLGYLKANGFIMTKEQLKRLTAKKFEDLEDGYKEIWRSLIEGDDEGNSILTFSMITRLAIHILETNPYILEALRKTYSNVFIDEFQDTTSLQYELMKVCFYNSMSSITAVGDEKQRIMLWAGAKANVFKTFEHEFGAKTYELLMNHRSAPLLLKLQATMNNYLQDKPFTPTPNSRWNSDQGKAEVWYSTDSIIEAQEISNEIKLLIEEHDIKYNDICIIVRQTVSKFADVIIPVLEEMDIEARNEELFQDLLKEDIILLLIKTLQSALDVRDSSSWLYIWDAKIQLENKMHTTNNSIIDELRNELKNELRAVRINLKGVENKEDLYVIVNKVLDYYNLEKIRSNYPQYAQGDYVEILIENFIDYLFEYYKKTDDWLAAIDSFKGKNSVPIMTVHKSKGLEFEAVFFVGVDDSTFWGFEKAEQEEKYVFFVGLSRAKEFLYFTFSENRFGRTHKKDKVSTLYRILEESGVVEEYYIGHA